MAQELRPLHYHLYKDGQSHISEKDNVSENYEVISWRQNFQQKFFEVDQLQSIILEKNSDFNYLKGEMAMNKGFKTLRNGAWRRNFTQELFHMLVNIIHTHDREVQQQLLIKCRSWVEDQLSRFDYSENQTLQRISTRPQTAKTNIWGVNRLRPQTSLVNQEDENQQYISQKQKLDPVQKRPETSKIQYDRPETSKPQNFRPETGKIQTQRPLTGQFKPNQRPQTGQLEQVINPNRPESGRFKRPEQMSFLSRPQTGLQEFQYQKTDVFRAPSELIQHEMKDFISKKRTIHKDVLPAKERIMSYKRHLLIKDEEDESEEEEIIVKPAPGITATFISDSEEDLLLNSDSNAEDKDDMKDETLAEIQMEQPEPMNVPAKKKKKKRGKKKKKKKVYTASMIPDLKPFTNDEYTTLDDEEKLEYMEELWLKNRQKELVEDRLEHEIIDMKKQWAYEKMSMKQRTDFKIGTKTIGNQFEQLQYQQKEQEQIFSESEYDEEEGSEEESDEEKAQVKVETIQLDKPEEQQVIKKELTYERNNIQDLESRVAKNKLNQLRKLNNPIIQNHINLQQKPAKLESLSVFGQPKCQNVQRPLSAILIRNTLNQNQKDTQEEMVAVKNKLAEYEKTVELKTLNRAFEVPLPFCDENALKNRPRSAALVLNPFFKGKKKKKKRGKKKKK